MRILVNDYAGHPFPLQLSRELGARGHTVLHTYCESVQAPRGSFEKKSEGTIEVRPIRLLKDFDKYSTVTRWLQERELGKKLSEHVIRYAPDVVVSGNTPLGAQSLLLRECRQQGIGFVFWLQDVLGVGYRKALRKKIPVLGDFVGQAFERYEQWLLARSDRVVAITDDFISYMPEVVRQRDAACVIENWAPLDELPLEPKRNDWSMAQGLASTRNFIYSGTLGLKHNPSLLYALAKATATQKDVRVVVISEGIGADWLAERKREECLSNLILLPFQPFSVMHKVLAAGEVLVALLEKDAGAFAVPSKVLTYLCAKRSLLLAVPAENLAARIVQMSGAGWAVEPNDREGFVTAGLKLLDDARGRERMAAKGRAYAEHTFDIHRITDRFEAIIDMSCPSASVGGLSEISS